VVVTEEDFYIRSTCCTRWRREEDGREGKWCEETRWQVNIWMLCTFAWWERVVRRRAAYVPRLVVLTNCYGIEYSTVIIDLSDSMK